MGLACHQGGLVLVRRLTFVPVRSAGSGNLITCDLYDFTVGQAGLERSFQRSTFQRSVDGDPLDAR